LESKIEDRVLRPRDIAEQTQAIAAEVERVIIGKTDTVLNSVICLLCHGHLLLEDIPGVGKTTLAKALAKAVGGDFSRIQFTPDLLPSDITGSSIYNQSNNEFEFRPGPIFGNVVLVDEINRATPKTQSALLESMEEGQVTADGATRPLPQPFFVIATQNSIEMTGTFPLPEAQLDRFFMRLSLGYPSKESEMQILSQQQISHPLEHVQTVVRPDKLKEMQAAVRDVFVHETIRNYIVEIIRATREGSLLQMGSSPRGALHLMRAAQARAASQGFDFVRPDDVKAMAAPVLAHRVIPRAELRLKGSGAEEAIVKILESVVAPVPTA
jgi:MoxR-like ATPase